MMNVTRLTINDHQTKCMCTEVAAAESSRTRLGHKVVRRDRKGQAVQRLRRHGARGQHPGLGLRRLAACNPASRAADTRARVIGALEDRTSRCLLKCG